MPSSHLRHWNRSTGIVIPKKLAGSYAHDSGLSSVSFPSVQALAWRPLARANSVIAATPGEELG